MTDDRGAVSQREIIAHLAASELFALLTPVELAELACLFRPVEYRAGQLLGRRGEVDTRLAVIIGGGAAVASHLPRDAQRAEATLGYGGIIGQHGVFLGLARQTDVVAVMDTQLLCADGESLWRWLRSRPAVLDRLILADDIRQGLARQAMTSAVSGERIMALYRRHWLVLLRGMLLPVALLGFLALTASVLAPFFASPPAILVLGVVVLGLPILVAAWVFLDYYYDCLIVTNRRVIHVEQKPFIDVRRREAPLATIQDVQVLRPGLLARLFGYGDVVVQTAGSRGLMRLRHVADPDQVQATIFEQVEQSRAFDRERYRRWVAEQVQAMVRGTDAPARELWMEDEAANETDQIGLDSPPAAPLRALAWLLPKVRLQQGSVVTWRKHWWVLVRRSFIALLAALLLAAAMLSLLTAPLRGGPSASERMLPTLVIGSLLLAAIALLWWRFEDWRNDVYQLSDEHIVDVERRPLGFFEHRREAPLAQVQDVRYSVPNPLARLLNYGHVEIQTAAESGSFTFDYVYDPKSVQEEIFCRIDQNRRQREERERRQRAEEMRTWLAEYHRLVGGEAPPPLAPSGPS